MDEEIAYLFCFFPSILVYCIFSFFSIVFVAIVENG